MSMEKLIAEAEGCVEREYGRAGAKFGLTNNSDHESYAILLEEFEEAMDEAGRVDRQLSAFWAAVKCNDEDTTKIGFCATLEKYATFAACEFIQVAAMAKKAALTILDRHGVGGPTEQEGGSA